MLGNTVGHGKSLPSITWHTIFQDFLSFLVSMFDSSLQCSICTQPQRDHGHLVASKSLAADDACRKPSSAALASLSALSNVCRWKSWNGWSDFLWLEPFGTVEDVTNGLKMNGISPASGIHVRFIWLHTGAHTHISIYNIYIYISIYLSIYLSIYIFIYIYIYTWLCIIV